MKLENRYCILLLAVMTLAVYYPTLFAPFNSIDDKLLVQQLINRDNFSWTEHFFPGGRGHYYRPLVTLSYEFDKFAWGLEESFMHLESILVHTLNTVLIYLVAGRLAIFLRLTGNWLPLAAAALFALHPINTEAVNWITARTDLLAATGVYFSLYGILCFLRNGRISAGIAGAVGMGLGALAKEPALFFLPGAFVLLWLCRKGEGLNAPGLQPVSRRLIVSAAYLASVIGYFSLRGAAFYSDRGLENTVRVVSAQSSAGSVANGMAPTATALFETMLKATGFYFKKIFWPFPLNFATTNVSEVYVYIGILVLLLLCWLLYRRTLVSCIAVCSLFLASSALLVVLNPLAWTPVAERYLYIASGPFILALCFGSARILVGRLRFAVALLVPFLLVFAAYATASRNLIWQDNLTLYEDTVKKSPKDMSVKNELALALIAAGREEEGNSLMKSVHVIGNQKSSLNHIAVMLNEQECVKAREMLLERLVNPGPYQGRILEMLVKANTLIIASAPAQPENHLYYLEIVEWLERLYAMTSNPFYAYRLGQVHLIMKEYAKAQVSFAKAAAGFEETSLYKKPAEKLARDLKQQ